MEIEDRSSVESEKKDRQEKIILKVGKLVSIY